MESLVQGSWDVQKPFGISVRTWRSRLAISQEKLAERAGLHRTYVCDVERGARNVSLQSIEKIARALCISTATLFSYNAPPGETETARLAGEGLVDILFVEDNPQDAALAMEALKRITNSVQEVHDGQAALDFLFCQGEFVQRHPNQRPQLILLDLGLPKIGGLEVLERVKSDPRTAMIPVVVLTGSDRDRDIRASKRLGAAACIVKPVDVANLAQVTPILHYQWALLKPAPAPCP
jgi:CheY-like chemotaxis protein/DNA-binding transcriptional regulator YdaS (Cro superfamily)